MANSKSGDSVKCALVNYRDETPVVPCPYGNAQRIVTGGEGGIANVHVITVTRGNAHVHKGYDEVYYVLSGTGVINIDGEEKPLRSGTVAVIPAGIPHSIYATQGEQLEFVIFGTPSMSIDDPRAKPEKA
ncbi:MAG: cupin domain-containing protein [Planctomycetes bacterium]|nr:cupin domain-containing protein [Planctomycetota bacterium]